MNQQSHRSRDSTTSTSATELDPLLRASAQSSHYQGGSIRSRRTSSRSPATSGSSRFGSQEYQGGDQMNSPLEAESTNTQNLQDAYQAVNSPSNGGNSSLGDSTGSSRGPGRYVSGSRSVRSLQRQYKSESDDGENPPLLEIPEQIYGVRVAALKVLKPLTKTWLVVSVGFALTVLFGMARWTRLLESLPYWFILLPSWLSHVGLFYCHLLSAKALSKFIAEANDSRQRPDSRDHLDRTEYLPILQRSLKFGFKTGLISFGIFILEILVYLRLSKGTLALSTVFFPLWIMVSIGIVEGIICKSQHPIRVLCWILTFAAMLLASLKVDHGVYSIQWRMIVCPIIAVLSIASATLIYIVYGHQVGYYRLTESQLKAGKLYSLAALISTVLAVIIGEVIPLARPVEIETRVFLVLMAPLVVVMVGMGAYAVTKDEFSRLLMHGGQAAVHPQKLRWESKGWTSVQGKGVQNIPMFGEVSFHPLEQKATSPPTLEMCACCSCYPYEEDEEDIPYPDNLSGHPYLAAETSASQYTQPQDAMGVV